MLGYNGSGKSSLLKIMAGRRHRLPRRGAARAGATVGLLEQEPQLDAGKTVRECVEDGVAETKALLDRFNELAANYSDETAEEFADLQAKIDAADAWNLDTALDYAMDALRCPPSDADVDKLSGGERRRVALCRLLLGKPDLLLLDEPTNHLDAESVAWLERHLAEYAGAVVAVTHDRYFLDNVAGWILELDRGTGIPYKGNYSSWLEQKQERLQQEEKGERSRQKAIAEELEWVRQNPKGRQKKQKARLNNYEALLAEERTSSSTRSRSTSPPGPRLGDVVVEAEGLRKGFGDKLLIEDLSFSLPRGGIVGDHRRQRRGQDDAVPDDHRPGAAGRRRAARRRHRRARLRRPEPRRARRREDRLGGDLRRQGPDQGRRAVDEHPPVHAGVQLQGLRPAEEGRQALRRRAQPPAPRQAAAQRRQRAAARRADQRPRRRHAARARGGAARRSPAAR